MIPLTKYITSELYQGIPFTKAFLELVDECMWCWFMEAYENINVLSYEEMDLHTLAEFFASVGISVPLVKGKELNKNALLHYNRIIHSRGERTSLENLVNSGGFIYPENPIDAKLYYWYDVPKDLVADPKDGYIYMVATGSTPLKDKDLLDSMTPAGYRIVTYRQVPIIEIKAIGDVQFNKSLSRVIYICAPVQASFAHLYSGKVLADYHRPQFNETWSFTEMFKSGYSIHRLDKKHIQHFFFHFETEEKNLAFIESTLLDNDMINAISPYSLNLRKYDDKAGLFTDNDGMLPFIDDFSVDLRPKQSTEFTINTPMLPFIEDENILLTENDPMSLLPQEKLYLNKNLDRGTGFIESSIFHEFKFAPEFFTVPVSTISYSDIHETYYMGTAKVPNPSLPEYGILGNKKTIPLKLETVNYPLYKDNLVEKTAIQGEVNYPMYKDNLKECLIEWGELGSVGDKATIGVMEDDKKIAIIPFSIMEE